MICIVCVRERAFPPDSGERSVNTGTVRAYKMEWVKTLIAQWLRQELTKAQRVTGETGSHLKGTCVCELFGGWGQAKSRYFIRS